MKKIFIMNLGTTSFKFKLYHVTDDNMDVRASGEIESVGAEMSRWQYSDANGKDAASYAYKKQSASVCHHTCHCRLCCRAKFLWARAKSK